MVSLIIPTINRKDELKMLLESIYINKYKNIEVIIIDQNKPGFLDDIICKYRKKIDLLHLNVDFKGAARARNYGFKFSNGDIINFPDDDSELNEDILIKVNNFYKEYKGTDMVFGRTVDRKYNTSSVVKFGDEQCDVNISNIYKTTVECTMFIKREAFKKLNGFDESLGVGTYYGAEEGADLVLRALYLNIKAMYDPKVIFYHPQKISSYDVIEQKRAYSYGLGFGRVTVKHLWRYKKVYPLYRFIKFNSKYLIGILIALGSLNKNKVKYYYQSIKGRNVGAIKSVMDYMNS